MNNNRTVNGKGGDAKDGLVDLDKFGVEAAVLIRNDDSASNGEVAVKPGVPDTASVGFDANLEVSLLRALGDGPNLGGLV